MNEPFVVLQKEDCAKDKQEVRLSTCSNVECLIHSQVFDRLSRINMRRLS